MVEETIGPPYTTDELEDLEARIEDLREVIDRTPGWTAPRLRRELEALTRRLKALTAPRRRKEEKAAS